MKRFKLYQRQLNKQWKDQSGFTLVEVLVSILILSILVTSFSVTFTLASKVTFENKLKMTAMNLANEAIENIRSKKFADVGTKNTVTGVYGDPKGEIPQSREEEVDGVKYIIKTDIVWEEEGEWEELGNMAWDYKYVKIMVYPKNMEGQANVTKTIETYVTRDSAQPAIPGGNIRTRIVHGWNISSGTKIPVSNGKMMLTAGPDAPKQVLTNVKGAARFINLTPGNYTVQADVTSLGMIILPGTSQDTRNISNYSTEVYEFQAEYPCGINLKFKEFDGTIIDSSSGISGDVLVITPYGDDINKTFTSGQIDSQGNLPSNFISNLWPVGDSGYAGAYSISNIVTDKYFFLGAYETLGGAEVLWDGKYTAPGTSDNVTCYFGTYPNIPDDIVNNWVNSRKEIKEGSYTSKEGSNIISGILTGGNTNDTLKLPSNKTSHFNAYAIYFKNVGNNSNMGLLINDKAKLYLHTGTVVLSGGAKLNTASTSNQGKIIFSTTYQDGSMAECIDGSEIGLESGIKYGKLYVMRPILHGTNTIVEPGAYYYYDGLTLPADAGDLVRMNKENFTY